MAEKSYLDGQRILIVDDESDVLESLEELLPMCDIAKAYTFDEAKELLESQYFDIAVIDIMGVNGYELLEIARKRKVIGVMLTGKAVNPENIVRCHKEGAASFLPKEEMANITTFLNDVLEAKEKGKSYWWRWFDRLGSYCEKNFGPDWRDEHKEYWDKLSEWR